MYKSTRGKIARIALPMLAVFLVAAFSVNTSASYSVRSTLSPANVVPTIQSTNSVIPSVATPLTFPLKVNGNELTTSTGSAVQLIGADRSGMEYSCLSGNISDGPINSASISAMRTWHINAVRIPLNEDCWLGINGVPASSSGANYQTQVFNFVQRLNSQGIVAILDLHWNAPGTTLSTGQQFMADEDHAPAFWTSVATYFKNTPGVIFDLYNEPQIMSWTCWLNGCLAPQGWRTAGMQQLVNTVRATGATQPIMVGGINFAEDLSNWLQYEPIDPEHNLIASVHVYNNAECSNVQCWNTQIAPVAAKVPVVTGELGQSSCASNFTTSYMNWADLHYISYLAWTWDTWGCGNWGIISNYDGTPTAEGLGIEQHFDSLYASDLALQHSTAEQNAPVSYIIGSASGGIFTFGNAPFYGSMGGHPLNKPIVGITADPATGGYWLVASDGGVFSFNAPFYGSMGGHPSGQVIGMAL